MHFVDRRANPSGKSLPNRQRFVARTKEALRGAIGDALAKRSLSNGAEGGTVTIPTRNITEPNFRRADDKGVKDRVLPGNDRFVPGDRIAKPEQGGGGAGGREGSPDGQGEDAFEFALSRTEFLDILFDEMELPNLARTAIGETTEVTPHRAGFTQVGTPSALSVTRTLRNSLGRRIALSRPRDAEVREVTEALAEAEARGEDAKVIELRERLARMDARRRAIPFIDPLDLRFHHFERRPKPVTKAVMFCLMDVSGSMTEHMKGLAKRFFLLLHLFLERHYEKVHVVFIRHSTEASEVDEHTFFHSRETGGTIISSALSLMIEIMRARYSPSEWNVYAAQASDGDNYPSDGPRCRALMENDILPATRYFAYVEVGQGRPTPPSFGHAASDLWRTYAALAETHETLAMRRVGTPAEIYPVFHDLFARNKATA
jgi:uncharacterized sporulation protein YeaH/YhbH (DUF444 family)